MKVSELLSAPHKWLKGSFAVAAGNHTVDPCSYHACRWCLAGAVDRVRWKDGLAALSILGHLQEVIFEKGYEPKVRSADDVVVSRFNDHKDTTFDMVREVVLEAEARAEKERVAGKGE